MKWQYHECPALRTVGGGKVAAIVTEDGFTVCEPMPLETAQQIIREHNAHDDLVKALQEARNFIDQYGTYGQLEYGRAKSKRVTELVANIDAELAKVGAA